tara:strand:+ start:3904 stop:4368 length:465 start_codon:yes stop_codon:yes gene_type:complete
MKLSKNLSLSEISKSNTATRLGIDNTPSGDHLENIKFLAENIFQPIRSHFGKPIFVSSGYRSEKLNKAIGGAASSQHCKGEALDLDNDATNNPSNKEIFDYIVDNLKFDQLINEFPDDEGNPSWVHVSVKANGQNRKQILKAVKVSGRTKYEIW